MADRRLRVFYTVARLLSFTRAAEALHMTQPAVTFQSRQLEDHLDTRLFDRGHNRVTLTEPGRKVYEYAERIFELYAEMENALKELTRNVSGALTLGVCDGAAECLLPALLRDFKRKHPELNLGLKVLGADNIVSMVESGAIDAGVVEGQVEARNMRMEPGPVDQLALIVQPDHPLGGRDRVGVEALARYPLICREEGSRAREIIMNYAAANGRDPSDLNISLELENLDAIKAAVEAGMGIAIVPRSSIVKELELGALVCISLDPPLERPFSFVHQPRKSRPVEELLDFARGYGLAKTL
jgi:DNA-binding transcriptional LysR family regulator